MDLVIGLAFNIVCGLICWRVATKRNRSAAWLLAGLLLNLVGVIWVSCLPSVARRLPTA